MKTVIGRLPAHSKYRRRSRWKSCIITFVAVYFLCFSTRAIGADSTTLMELQFGSDPSLAGQELNRTLLQMFNQTDRNEDGRIDRNEFSYTIDNLSGATGGLSAHIRNWIDFFRNWFRPNAASKSKDRMGSLLWETFGNGTLSEETSPQIDFRQFSEEIYKLFKTPFLNNNSYCELATQRLESCQEPKDVFMMAAFGDLITVTSARCRQGFGHLSKFIVERCVIEANDCKDALKCYEREIMYRRSMLITRTMLSWMFLEGIKDKNGGFDCEQQLRPAIECSIDAFDSNNTDLMPDLLQLYQYCARYGSDVANLFMKSCGLTLNGTCPPLSQSCLDPPGSLTAEWSKFLAENNKTMITRRIRRRNFLLVLFPVIYGPLAMFLPVLLLSIIIFVPIMVPTIIRIHNGIASNHNLHQAGNTQLLVPIDSVNTGDRPTSAFNLSDPTQGAVIYCKTNFYWSTCGVPGSEAAKNCTAGGGRLWRPDSCASYTHFTEGSIICGKANGISIPGVQMINFAESGKMSKWEKFKDFLSMGPLRFKCQSLCVRFDSPECDDATS